MAGKKGGKNDDSGNPSPRACGIYGDAKPLNQSRRALGSNSSVTPLESLGAVNTNSQFSFEIDRINGKRRLPVL